MIGQRAVLLFCFVFVLFFCKIFALRFRTAPAAFLASDRFLFFSLYAFLVCFFCFVLFCFVFCFFLLLRFANRWRRLANSRRPVGVFFLSFCLFVCFFSRNSIWMFFFSFFFFFFLFLFATGRSLRCGSGSHRFFFRVPSRILPFFFRLLLPFLIEKTK